MSLKEMSSNVRKNVGIFLLKVVVDTCLSSDFWGKGLLHLPTEQRNMAQAVTSMFLKELRFRKDGQFRCIFRSSLYICLEYR